MTRSWKIAVSTVALALASTGCTTVIRSSSAPHGQAANALAESLGPQTISDNGRFTAFTSEASNLVPGDTNGAFDVFRHDNVNGRTTRVSLKDDGAQLQVSTAGLAMSGDGNSVAFFTDQALEPADTNGTTDVYVRTVNTGTTERVSIKPDGTPIFTGGDIPQSLGRTSISDDGRYVLVTDSMPNQGHAYLRDRVAHTTVLLAEVAASAFLAGNGSGIIENQLCTGGPCSFSSSFLPANGTQGEHISDGCGFEAYDVSADARYVVGRRFGVYPTFECPEPTGMVRWDRTTKSGTKVGVETNNVGGVSMSNDGRFVSVLDDAGVVHVVDLKTAVQQVADSDFLGRRSDAPTAGGSLSGNGRYIVINTDAPLSPNDGNGRADTFTRFAVTPTVASTTPASVARGASHVVVQVHGTELLPAATVAFPNGGVTVHSVTVVNPNRLDVDLSVAPDAPTGPALTFATNTGLLGGSNAVCACLTIT